MEIRGTGDYPVPFVVSDYLLLRLFGAGCCRSWGGSRLVLLFDREQFNFENQCRAGADVRTGATISVRQFSRDVKLPLRADWHELYCFRPTLNHSADREGSGLAALVRTVEFFAIDRVTAIIANDGVAGGWLRACAGRNYFVLQSAGQDGHAGLRLVSRQKSISLRLILAFHFFHLRHSLFANGALHLRQHVSGFLIREQVFAVLGQGVLQT